MNGELGKGCGSIFADSANNVSNMACGRFLKLKVWLSHQAVEAAEGRSIAPLQVKALQQAAPSLGVALQIHDIRTADDLPAAFEAGARESADGLFTTAESIFVAQRARVSELALQIAGDVP